MFSCGGQEQLLQARHCNTLDVNLDFFSYTFLSWERDRERERLRRRLRDRDRRCNENPSTEAAALLLLLLRPMFNGAFFADC